MKKFNVFYTLAPKEHKVTVKAKSALEAANKVDAYLTALGLDIELVRFQKEPIP